MIAALLWLARPLLQINLAQYKRDVGAAIFPDDDPDPVIAGPDADRLLFIGDVAVAGYGVLRHGMTTAARTARLVARDRERGCRWRTIAAPDLTAARAARMQDLYSPPVDAVLIMMGVPDVLLATNSARWAADLRLIVDHIRARSGSQCRVIFAAIPPMGDFRPIPAPARRILTLQIHQLNRATRAIAAQIPHASFVPFPNWRVGEMYVQDLFSWKALHEMWAGILASAATEALDAADSSATDSESR